LRHVVVAEVEAEVVVDTASPAVVLLQVVRYGVRDRRPANVIAIAAACRTTAAACRITVVQIVATGRVIAVINAATCRTTVMIGLMMYKTRARKDARIGRIMEMMCATTAVTGMMIVTVEQSVSV
jgi:hypothetical protein